MTYAFIWTVLNSRSRYSLPCDWWLEFGVLLLDWMTRHDYNDISHYICVFSLLFFKRFIDFILMWRMRSSLINSFITIQQIGFCARAIAVSAQMKMTSGHQIEKKNNRDSIFALRNKSKPIVLDFHFSSVQRRRKRKWKNRKMENDDVK